MAVLTVGAGSSFSTIDAAVAAAQPGDTIDINTGTYVAQDLMLANDITLEAAGNGPVIVTEAGHVQKGLFIAGKASGAPDITIRGLTFQGADAGAGNGAGIRYQSGNLTLIGSTFADNDDGILATPFVQGTGTVIVQGSTFVHNGVRDGQSHDIYIGHVADFSISNSLVEAAVVGHEIKSRALNTQITNNVIADGPGGSSSYEIDLPNGGNAIVQGNTIEKGPHGQNPWMISFGEEGASGPGSLIVADNLMLNDRNHGGGIRNASGVAANVTNNDVYGLAAGRMLKGPGIVSGTAVLSAEPSLSAIISGGTALGFIGGSTPDSQAITPVDAAAGSSGSGLVSVGTSYVAESETPPVATVAGSLESGSQDTLIESAAGSGVAATDFGAGATAAPVGQGVTISSGAAGPAVSSVPVPADGTLVVGYPG